MWDWEAGNKMQRGVLNPESRTLDPVFLERVRWRCRRGLLELDIVLGRFVEQSYAQLDEAGRVTFDALLDMPDSELWDMITGRTAPAEDARALMDKIRVV